jgi:hypothetical protein
MTAHFIARVVENLYNKIDIDAILEEFNGIKQYDDCGRKSDEWVNKQIKNKGYYRWLLACGKLEEYLYLNYATFEETELVYRWGKRVCNQRNYDLNKYRCGYRLKDETFEIWLKKASYRR